MGKLYIQYLPLEDMLDGKRDRRGYIYGDRRGAGGMTDNEYAMKLAEEYTAQYNQEMNMSFFGHAPSRYNIRDVREEHDVKMNYKWGAIECDIMNMRYRPMQPGELVKCRQENLMFIIIVDIPFSKLETSLEDEVRFWVKDSMNINVHHEIPEEERLKMLPIRNLKIEIVNISGELHDCRIIDYKNTGRISILVNEIK